MSSSDPYRKLEEAAHLTAWREQYRSKVYQKALKRARRLNFALRCLYLTIIGLLLYGLLYFAP